ncbi:hypothetical protein GP486_000715 [Trichoglossum hirsutum]|uniref:Dienelactone hydrolase domain-containing protein n=1 Tax=Trichoglossum hirsutum TaxID=265104 RepID=A0A9P8LHA1_9PEZI|nr:hypothetical protein GP486_000715 [Trichoglossum hirsutum]
MDETHVSTKPPGDDAPDGSIILGGIQAQGGANIGVQAFSKNATHLKLKRPQEHCIKDRPTPAGQNPMGEISELGDVKVYITKPRDYPHSPSKLLLFLTGGTGINSVNNQLHADKFASEGFLVVMPDMFQGDPAPDSATTDNNDYTEAHNSLIEQVKIRAAETAKAFMIDMWLARHTPEKVLPILYKVIEEAKEEFADAVASGEGVYAVGYCFGGKYVLLLAGEHTDTALWGQMPEDKQDTIRKGPSIKAGAVAHG